MVKLPSFERDYADVRTVGIPRGLLYYRYGQAWRAFFEALGRTVVVSEETDKAILDAGTYVSVDECCLASKIYMGHAESLIGRCDALFVPSYGSLDARKGFCTKFQSLPDLVTSTFRSRDVRVMSALIENISDRRKVNEAFMKLAARMGANPAEGKRACKAAQRAQVSFDRAKASAQEETLRLIGEYRRVVAGDEAGTEQKPLAILLVAHPYIAHDRYMSGAIIDALERLGATVIYADETNHEKAGRASFNFSSTLPWCINRELIGSILTLQDSLDGIVLVSAFPCGPDSMTDDAIMRCIQGTPILNLMIDAQSGTAGVETRVESFIDILRFQQLGGYVHA